MPPWDLKRIVTRPQWVRPATYAQIQFMKTALLASAFFLAAAGVIIAQENKNYQQTHPTAECSDPKAINWTPGPTALPPGAQAVILEGDPSKPAFFAMRLRMPANYKIPPHWHGAHERVTVLEGALWLGMGEKYDEAAAEEYPIAGYFSMPPKMKHFALTKQPTIVQIATVGPWTITYVNPQDDPRNKKTGR